MKRLIVFMLVGASVSAANAQNSKVSSAAVHVQDFEAHGDTTELLAAKAAIDEAALNEKTKDEPKMHLYRAEVYLMLFQMRLSALAKNMSAGKAYAAMDTTTIATACNSFMRVLQIAPKDYYSDEAKQKQNMPASLLALENKALMEYNTQHYASALALYEKSMDMDNVMDIKDSNYTENVNGAAISASKAGNTAKSLKYNQMLISMKAGGSVPYVTLSDMYLDQKDSTNSFSYIQQGRTAFPDDIQLIIKETNFYLARNNTDKAEANLLLSINKVEQMSDKDRNKKLLASLYAVLGNMYDKRANPKDAKGADAPKPANYEDLYSKAEANYTKGLAIDPDNFELLFNTGALYFNRGSGLTNEAVNLPLNAQDKYDKLKAEAKTYFEKAQPFFEKARTVNPKDQANTNALMQVYENTGQPDKAKALKQ